ncbi:MAG: hypothetical protein ACRDNB_01765 [Gaiellaceae bacterium]
MSLYREAGSGRRRWTIALGIGVVVAAVLVAVLALSGGGEQSPAEREAELQEDVRPALAALELVPIHYESSNETTHAAAADQLAVAQETVSEVQAELRLRDATGTSELLQRLDDLAELVRTTGRTEEVTRESAAAAAELRSLVGLPR